MLIGQYEHTIDNKKRLALPAKFRGELGDKVIVTKWPEGCLAVFTQEGWKAWSEKIVSMTIVQAEARSFARSILAGAMEVTLDKLGRILVPDYLKNYAGFKKNVIICGLSNRLEIWDSEKWEKYNKEAEKGIDETISKLGGMGI